MPGYRYFRLSAVASSFALLLCSSPLIAAKTDVVELVNGDHVTGEVQSLARGVLEFKTDHMGTVYVEWEDVARLTSDQMLEVELTSGTRYFGSIEVAAQPGELRVNDSDDGTTDVAISDTVHIAPVDEAGSLWDRLDSYVSFGFSATQSTDVQQLSFDAGTSYRDRKHRYDVDFTSIQSDSADQQSGSASLTGLRRRFFGNRWYWSGLLQLDQNDAQGLDLRTLAGGALGRFIVQTNHQEFALAAGLALAREDPQIGEKTDSVELMLGLDYEAFSFDDPDLDLSANFVVFPSLTVSGRVRAQANVRLRYELVSDLFIDFSLTESYDNKPQSAGAENNDYSITTSIGYDF